MYTCHCVHVSVKASTCEVHFFLTLYFFLGVELRSSASALAEEVVLWSLRIISAQDTVLPSSDGHGPVHLAFPSHSCCCCCNMSISARALGQTSAASCLLLSVLLLLPTFVPCILQVIRAGFSSPSEQHAGDARCSAPSAAHLRRDRAVAMHMA